MKAMRSLRIEERKTVRTPTVDMYFHDIKLEKMLTPEEEFALATRASTGDQKAIDALVTGNLRFAVSVAKQYSHNGENLMDLVAQGNVGLIRAAKTFDPTRGFKFISYAVWYIRAEIMSYFNQFKRQIRIPQHVVLILNEAKKVELELLNRNGYEANEYEIAEEMMNRGTEVTATELFHIRSVTANSVQLEPSGPDDEYLAPIQWIVADSGEIASFDLEDSKMIISKLIQNLSEQDRDIINKRIGLTGEIPMSYEAISHGYNKSVEWARTAYKKALRKAKKRAREINLTYIN